MLLLNSALLAFYFERHRKWHAQDHFNVEGFRIFLKSLFLPAKVQTTNLNPSQRIQQKKAILVSIVLASKSWQVNHFLNFLTCQSANRNIVHYSSILNSK